MESYTVTSSLTRVPWNLRNGRPWPAPEAETTERMTGPQVDSYLDIVSDGHTVVVRSFAPERIERQIVTRCDGFDYHLTIVAVPTA